MTTPRWHRSTVRLERWGLIDSGDLLAEVWDSGYGLVFACDYNIDPLFEHEFELTCQHGGVMFHTPGTMIFEAKLAMQRHLGLGEVPDA